MKQKTATALFVELVRDRRLTWSRVAEHLVCAFCGTTMPDPCGRPKGFRCRGCGAVARREVWIDYAIRQHNTGFGWLQGIANIVRNENKINCPDCRGALEPAPQGLVRCVSRCGWEDRNATW